MPKTKGGGWGASGGDWTDTGTFVRKPPTGWLHRDSDLTDGAYVRYRLSYLGCVQVTESMRSLQYQIRTQVTREAITRLAEESDRIQPNRKRKVPKQITRLLGESMRRLANEVNLCIDVDQLQLLSASSGRDIVSHSLTSISFASGGEGATLDFFGYVAKDPLHDRACHVFYCPEGTAQLVLASVGQAFELRFKMYLNVSQQPPPQSSPSSVAAGGPPPFVPSPKEVMSQRSLPPVPHPITLSSQPPKNQYSVEAEVHVHSEYESREYNDPLPPPISSLNDFEYEGSPSLSRHTGNKKSPQMLPMIPPPISEIVKHSPPLNHPRIKMLPPGASLDGEVYSDLPGFPAPEDQDDTDGGGINTERPLSYNPYDTMPPEEFISDARETNYEQVEDDEQIYSVPDDEDEIYSVPPEEDQQEPPPAPAEEEYQLITIKQQPSLDTNDCIELTSTPEVIDHAYTNVQASHIIDDYDDPNTLVNKTNLQPTKPGDYDDPDALLNAGLTLNDDDPPPPPHDDEVAAQMIYETTNTPFDDSIYAERQPQAELSLDPSIPLSKQYYYHGQIKRTDAEALLSNDGDFLVRESANKPGQYVLTGIANARPQHLLLKDKEGRIKSKDREFQSVPHLVKFFYDRNTPLTIGNCEVYLTEPIASHN